MAVGTECHVIHAIGPLFHGRTFGPFLVMLGKYFGAFQHGELFLRRKKLYELSKL